MPSNTQIGERLQKVFLKQTGRKMDEAMLSWCIYAFKAGYSKGEADFMANHDWYE